MFDDEDVIFGAVNSEQTVLDNNQLVSSIDQVVVAFFERVQVFLQRS